MVSGHTDTIFYCRLTKTDGKYVFPVKYLIFFVPFATVILALLAYRFSLIVFDGYNNDYDDDDDGQHR